MKNILVPIDFSDCSKAAAKFAIDLAGHYDANLTFVHVVHLPMVDPNMPTDVIEDMLEEGEQQARESYQAFRQELKLGDQQHAAFELRLGFVVSEIITVAKEKKADYILMGTHGAAGIRTILGSVTSSIVAKTDIPVFAIPENATFRAFRNIVYATNIREADVICLDQLMEFAKQVDATIHVVHVSNSEESPIGKEWADLKSAFWKEIKMEEVEFTIVKAEDVAQGLEAYIVENEPDLVAMLTAHRSFFDRIFHPSLTRRMAMHAKTPLLAFHA